MMDDVTISERENTYAKIKQFWIQHVGMRRVDKSMVEVLQMSKETRDKWMQQVKGKEYSTTRMDDYTMMLARHNLEHQRRRQQHWRNHQKKVSRSRQCSRDCEMESKETERWRRMTREWK